MFWRDSGGLFDFYFDPLFNGFNLLKETSESGRQFIMGVIMSSF